MSADEGLWGACPVCDDRTYMSLLTITDPSSDLRSLSL